MKPKLILCLALVLSGGLFGCSKAEQFPNVPKTEEISSTDIYTNWSANQQSSEQFFENHLNAMSPEKRRAAIKRLVMLGFPVSLPEVLTDVDDPAAKVLFLKHLSEPLSQPMLDEISKVARTEQNSELKFLYGVFLYRYNHTGGLETLEAILSDTNSTKKNSAVLILAINREDSSAASVVKILDQENKVPFVGSDELPVALGRWHNPIIQDYIKRQFQAHPRDADLALSVALGDQTEFLSHIQQMFKRRRADNDEKIFLAAALSRLSPNKDDNQGINFLIEELQSETPPPSSERGRVILQKPLNIVEALGYCGSDRAEMILHELVKTNASLKWDVVNQSTMLAGKAAVALSDNLIPKNRDALLHYLKSTNPQDFLEADRTRFVCNILNAETPELRLAMTNLVSTNIIAVAGTLKFKQIPSAVLPSLCGINN